jgi:hypothetical protein
LSYRRSVGTIDDDFGEELPHTYIVGRNGEKHEEVGFPATPTQKPVKWAKK